MTCILVNSGVDPCIAGSRAGYHVFNVRVSEMRCAMVKYLTFVDLQSNRFCMSNVVFDTGKAVKKIKKCQNRQLGDTLQAEQGYVDE